MPGSGHCDSVAAAAAAEAAITSRSRRRRAQVFQLYNAWTLYRLIGGTVWDDWHVPALSVLFAITAIGNLTTTLATVVPRLMGGGSRSAR